MLPRWLTERFDRLRARAAIRVLGDGIDEAARPGLEDALVMAGERLDAADVLRRSPHRAESIHVLVRSTEALEQAVDRLHRAVGPDRRPPEFSPEGLRHSLRSAAEGLATAPCLDAQLSRQDLANLAGARRIARRVHSDLVRVIRRRQTVVGRRAAIAAMVVVVAVAASVGIPLLQDRFEVSASGIYSPVFEADHAVDGDPAREWLAPDGMSAWWEIRFARPIDVTGVRIINAHNPGFNDRATRDLDIELHRKDELVARARSTFDQIDPAAIPRTIALKANGITRVRLVARTFHGRGAGLAEVEVIEAKKVNQ